jgi:hypothetical protein
MDSDFIAREMDEETAPPPQSQEEYLFLVSMVSSIADFPRMSHREQDLLMQNLEQYECYCQLDQLLRWRSVRPDRNHSQQLNDYLWVMRIQYQGLDSFDTFLDVAKNCVKLLQIPFSAIRLRILDEILGPDNFRAHLKVLRIVLPELQDVVQKVMTLERIALICEKKLFLEGEVEGIYAQILKLAPQNEKARKFKKLQHVHNMEWADAAEQLKVLAEHAENLQERARHKHELAQLYLYNLNQAGAAMELLRPMAIQYPETRHTLIEALERLEMHDELLSALISFERTARDADESAQFKFKRGNGLLKLGRAEESVKVYREALRLQPGSLLIHEALVSALLETGVTAQLCEQLMSLNEVVQLDSSKKTLSDLIDRTQKIVDLQGVTSKF